MRRELSGRITGTIKGPVGIAPGSVLDDARFESDGTTGFEGLVEFRGGATIRPGCVFDGTGWQRAFSCERDFGGRVPSTSEIVYAWDIEVFGARKGIVGDGMVLLGETDVHDCQEDGIFHGKGGMSYLRGGTTRRTGSTATKTMHCDDSQSLGATRGVLYKRWKFLDDSAGRLVAKNSVFFLRSFVAGPPGDIHFHDCDIDWWWFGLAWFPFENGYSPHSLLDVQRCRFGARFAQRPGGQIMALYTDAPGSVRWEGNRLGAELWTPEVLRAPSVERATAVEEMADWVDSHEDKL